MHPYLIKIGSFKLPAYGVFVALAFMTALTLAVKRAEREGIEKEVIVDLSFWILISGIIGARFYFVLENLSLFVERPWEIFFLWKGGLALFGGIVGGTVGGYLYCKKRGLDLKKTADIVGWVLPLAQAIGRIGCLCAGCCYGKPCHLPWAITFTNPYSLARIGVPLHPTQIYHMVANLIIFFILTYLYNRKRFDGQIFSLYLILYSLGRFFVEFFRGDYRIYIGIFSLPQWFCIFTFAFGILLYRRIRDL